ncbi:hypothetical protein CR513_39847, partial [Mucuna pruriens]
EFVWPIGRKEGQRSSDRTIERPTERQRERSRSRQRVTTWHHGTIATISGGSAMLPLEQKIRKRERREVHIILTSGNVMPNLVITFDDRDLRHGPARCDELMVISVVATEASLDTPRQLYQHFILVNTPEIGTTTIQAIRVLKDPLWLCGERVPVKGVIELETVFGENSGAKSIPVLYTVLDVEASYNIIMGRPALNRLGAVVSTLHLCMKLPVEGRVGSVWANSHLPKRCFEDNLKVGSQPPQPAHPAINVLDLNLDPRCKYEHERSHLAEDLKEIQVGLFTAHMTKIGVALGREEEVCLTHFLKDNNDVFAWTTDNMLGIDPKFMCHNLFVSLGAKPVV